MVSNHRSSFRSSKFEEIKEQIQEEMSILQISKRDAESNDSKTYKTQMEKDEANFISSHRQNNKEKSIYNSGNYASV